jgi:hypothetical protein
LRIRTLTALTSAAVVLIGSVGLAGPANASTATAAMPAAHSVPIDTQTVSAGDYLLKYNANLVSHSVDIDLTVGSGLNLTTDDTGALRITDATGELKDRLDLPALVDGEGTNVSAWSVTDAHHAEVTLSQAAIDEGAASTRISQKWLDCMANHGISGAIAGAVAGCAATIAIGCVEGAVTGGAATMIGSIVAGLWDCRSKW